MSSYFFNLTNFDIQLWPPPSKTDPKAFADQALNPYLFLPLLLIYHALTSIVLQTPNPQDYQGRRDTVWYRFCLFHLFVLECFMIHFLLIYQKHCSLSENVALLLYTVIATVIHSVA